MGKESKHHDHNAYLAKIRSRADSKARRAELAKTAVKTVGKMIGIGTRTSKQSIQKDISQHPYVKAKRQQVGKSTYMEISPARPTPANDYLTKKREATRAYDYTNQKKKIKAPYPTRS